MPPNTVSVTRPGRWGNPFDARLLGPDLAVEMFRDLMSGFFDPFKLKHLSDEEFASLHVAKESWLGRLNWGNELRAGARSELRGKNLACFCPLCERHRDGKPLNIACSDCSPCHVDPLGETANDFICEAIAA
jgi:hypothetical protein